MLAQMLAQMSALVMTPSSSNLFRNNTVCRYIARPDILVRLQIYILIGNTRFASHLNIALTRRFNCQYLN